MRLSNLPLSDLTHRRCSRAGSITDVGGGIRTALGYAMMLATELGFRNVCFETDYLKLYNGGKNFVSSAFYFSSLLADCRILVS